jgi:CheY-like chemotaxis protein
MKVALVEDDFSYRKMMSDFLEDLGYLVVQADQPEKLEGIERCDAFIMDVMIPPNRTGGIDYIIDLQTRERINDDTLVIFISNFGRESKEIQDRLAQIKNYEWLDKPVDLVTLERLLRQKKEGKRHG